MKKWRTMLLLSAVVLGLLIWSGFKLYSPNTLPIRVVTVNGDLRFINRNNLQQALAPLTHQGFFSVDLDKIHVAVQQLPWVAEVEVKRIWPDKIVIDITTCRPVARWNNTSLLNAYGEIFVPNSFANVAKDLPRFFGKGDQTVKMLDNYQQMNNILQALDLKIALIRYTADNAWQVGLNNGIELQLGQKEVVKRLNRFVQTYKKLLAERHNSLPKSVDLRYNHGMAVKW